jgi:RNA polymerase sigma-70 factor (ECF subfamily)
MSETTTGETVELLQRWHAGEREALHELLKRFLPRLHQFASAKLHSEFSQLQREQDSLDLVQTSAAKALEYVPPFVPRDDEQFFGLLCTFVMNHLRNRLRAGRQAGGERKADFGDSVLDLRASERSSEFPSQAVQENEERAWARFALEFLPETERRLVLLRVVEQASWEEVASDLGMTPDAARMRFNRLMPELANLIRRLREGHVDDLLSGTGAAGTGTGAGTAPPG